MRPVEMPTIDDGDAAHAASQPRRVPSPALVAHLGSKDVFQRLLKFVRRQGVAARDAEDVVQHSLQEAWQQRDWWGPASEDLDRFLYRIARCNVLDHKKAGRRSVTLLDKKPDGSDEDDPTVDGVAPPAAFEARDQLRRASEVIDKAPGLARPARWLLRHYAGESFAEIAAIDGVSENAVATAVSKFRARMRATLLNGCKLMLAVVVAGWLWSAVRRRPDDTAASPRPAHSSIAPIDPQSPDALRLRAFKACDDEEWAECLRGLDAAAERDPAGDKDERVQAMRKAARERLELR